MPTTEELVVLLVSIGLVGICVVAVTFAVKRVRKPIKERNMYLKAQAETYLAIYYGAIKHFEGLPFAKSVNVNFFYGTDRLVFTKDNQEVSLDRGKIISMDIISGRDIKNQTIAGAVAGSLILGGIIGALVANGSCLVITYKREEETKFILLDTLGSNLPFLKLIKDFKENNHRDKEKIEL